VAPYVRVPSRCSCPAACTCLLFRWYGHHRDLHSFPTRRSSDLRGPGERVGRPKIVVPVVRGGGATVGVTAEGGMAVSVRRPLAGDRKSTRLNSSHVKISYAVFCLKKKTARARSRAGPGPAYGDG